MQALGALGEHAAPHAGAIAALLGDDDFDLCSAAVRALGALDEHTASHVDSIAALLEHGDAGVRRDGGRCWVLGAFVLRYSGGTAALCGGAVGCCLLPSSG